MDYFVVGTGIAGASLALELDRRGHRLVVFDAPESNTASGIAAGLINPIVPRRVIPAWKAAGIFPGIEKYYAQCAEITGTDSFQALPMYQFHKTAEEAAIWKKQAGAPELNGFLEFLNHSPFPGLESPYGCSRIYYSGRLHVQDFCENVWKYLSKKHSLIREKFNHSELNMNAQTAVYKDFRADGIVFCEGTAVRENPFFNTVPVRSTWGDIIRIDCPQLQINSIIKHKYWIIPEGEGHYLTGSNFIHEAQDTEAAHAEAGRITDALKKILPPFEVVRIQRAARPTVPDRRPVLGAHPEWKNMWIYNGLGTRGCSLVTYLSPILADHITTSLALPEEVAVSRYFS